MNERPDRQEIEREYARCTDALCRAGIAAHLPESGRMGVIGLDENEYPMPTAEQVVALLRITRSLLTEKLSKGLLVYW